jgi:four helix bundle protein
MQDFRKLIVWQEAHANVLAVRKAANGFPRSGYSALKLQLTRAVESIPYNIVEGAAASSQKEFARYLDISIKSSSETEYQLQLAHDYGLIKDAEWKVLNDQTVVLRKRLYRLREKVQNEEPD